MANKFSISEIIPEASADVKKKPGRPKNENDTKQHGDPVRERLPYGYQRATFHLREDLVKRLKNIAFTDRKRIQEIANKVMETGIEILEAEHREAGIEILEKPEEEPVTVTNKKKAD